MHEIKETKLQNILQIDEWTRGKKLSDKIGGGGEIPMA